MSGNIGTGDAAVLALLADTARAGRGGYGGYWGGGGYGGEGGYGGLHGAGFTTPSSIQHGLDFLSRQQTDQAACIRDQFDNQNIRGALAAITSGQQSAEARVSEKLSNTQLNSLRESADLARQIAACCCETQREVAATSCETQKLVAASSCDAQKGFLEQALKAQECCCETQKLVFQENQRTRDVIMDNELRRATDANNVASTVGAINAAAAQNTAAIIAAIQSLNGNGHHHGH